MNDPFRGNPPPAAGSPRASVGQEHEIIPHTDELWRSPACDGCDIFAVRFEDGAEGIVHYHPKSNRYVALRFPRRTGRIAAIEADLEKMARYYRMTIVVHGRTE